MTLIITQLGDFKSCCVRKSEADALASQRLSEALRSALDNFSKVTISVLKSVVLVARHACHKHRGVQELRAFYFGESPLVGKFKSVRPYPLFLMPVTWRLQSFAKSPAAHRSISQPAKLHLLPVVAGQT